MIGTCCFYSVEMVSISASHISALASLGIIQPPLGDNVTLYTAGPSGIQERLNCCEKKRR